jgi:hypothetical protein
MAISLEDEAFYELVNRLLKEVRKDAVSRDKWVDGEEAMKYMRITSKTTLQKLRDTAAIRFTQPFPKHILYDLDSIDAYLSKHANK